VVVGGPGVLQYNPSSVNANVGDVVQFVFQQKNHTATQSTFETPCSPAPGGFDSGFVPVADNVTSGFPVAALQIINTDPIWVYCRQANHCQQGMVFAVNPGSNFAAFQAAAEGGAVLSSTASGTGATSTPASSAPTSSATSGTDHRIVVGGPNILAYSPSNITAQVGDTVTFEFHEKNHTVTQSAFNTPCRALASTSTSGQIGFDSGFMPVADGAVTFPTFTIVVNDTNPIWAYCRQANHCGQGMVFAVNAVESGPKNFSAFQALAMQQNGTTTTTSTTPAPTSDAQTVFTSSYLRAWMAAALFIIFLV